MVSKAILDIERVRTRAYYFWHDRTGVNWEEPTSNWNEAIEYERLLLAPRSWTTVQPYTWPFRAHFSRIARLSEAQASDVRKPVVWSVTLNELRALRDAYERISAAAPQFDYICGFACGAVSLMSWISACECLRIFGHSAPQTLYESSALQHRLHLFPGISWARSSEIEFLAFLCGLGARSRIMVVDCSFTGGAVGAVANTIVSQLLEHHIEIFAVVASPTLVHSKVANALRFVQEHRIGNVVLQEVPSLLAEDFPELLGYDSLQPQHRLLPQWRPGVVIISDASTDLCHVRACDPPSATFQDCLANADNLEFSVEALDVPQTAAELLYFVLRSTLQNEYTALLASDVANDAFALIRARGRLCGRWYREVRAIAEHFDIVIDANPPEFCASVSSDRAVMRGELVELLIEPYHDMLLFSIRCGFRDSNGRNRTDFSFLLSSDELRVVWQRDGATLADIVPSSLTLKFEAMWDQLDPRQRDRLDREWERVRSRTEDTEEHD